MTDYLLCVLIALIALWLNYWMTRYKSEEGVPVPWIVVLSLFAGGFLYGALRLIVWAANQFLA